MYVGNDHICWIQPELRRRVEKKRFGNVHHSRANGLAQMMQLHASEVREWILQNIRQTGDTTEDEAM